MVDSAMCSVCSTLVSRLLSLSFRLLVCELDLLQLLPLLAVALQTLQCSLLCYCTTTWNWAWPCHLGTIMTIWLASPVKAKHAPPLHFSLHLHGRWSMLARPWILFSFSCSSESRNPALKVFFRDVSSFIYLFIHSFMALLVFHASSEL